MIIYQEGPFNFNLFLRFSGSPLYRGMLQGILAIIYYFCLIQYRKYYGSTDTSGVNTTFFERTTGVDVLVAAVSLAIIFKVENAYSRHWEAYSRVFAMMSKFQDATQHIMVYHMQCDHYLSMRPPSYFDHGNLNERYSTRDRERTNSAKSEHNLDYSDRYGSEDDYIVGNSEDPKVIRPAKGLKAEYVERLRESLENGLSFGSLFSGNFFRSDSFSIEGHSGRGSPKRLPVHSRLDGGWGKLNFSDKETGETKKESATFYNKLLDPPNDLSGSEGFASAHGGRTPALFLQELLHLTSLLNAVALSTLRNDIDEAESPLDYYMFSDPMPEADPDKIDIHHPSLWESILRITGADLSPDDRSRYNSTRPLHVIGGVSNAEIHMLQVSRGAYAKTQLCFNWLSEFYIRESLAGTYGETHAALISRSMQFLSGGMKQYNHARKIMYSPFPFPHAQLAVFFSVLIIPGIPLTISTNTKVEWLGAILSFLAVSCLCGLHEMSRELENPFRRPPNDVPICTLQAQFNEALITAFSGYHPDSYFDTIKKRSRLTRGASIDEDSFYFDFRKQTSSIFAPKSPSVFSRTYSLKSLSELAEGDEDEDDIEYYNADDGESNAINGDAKNEGDGVKDDSIYLYSRSSLSSFVENKSRCNAGEISQLESEIEKHSNETRRLRFLLNGLSNGNRNGSLPRSCNNVDESQMRASGITVKNDNGNLSLRIKRQPIKRTMSFPERKLARKEKEDYKKQSIKEDDQKQSLVCRRRLKREASTYF